MQHIQQDTMKIFVLLATLVFALSPAFALALEEGSVTTSVRANATVETGTKPAGVRANASTTASVKAERLGAAETRAKERGALEIDRRTKNLNELRARIAGIKNLSESNKATITATVEAQEAALAELKAKISAGTDVATVKADVQSITGSYRTYALFIPQVQIIAAADRIVSIATQMQALSAKLQARISAAQVSGADVSVAANAWTDFNAKIADAQTKAQAAVTLIATLAPDEGDKTKLAANTKALQEARAKVVAGQKDLQTARKDVDIILKAIKGKPVKAEADATASSTTSAGTGQ